MNTTALSHNRRAIACAQILVMIWQGWDDSNEDVLEDAMRIACENARAIDMHQVDGVIASPLNYYVRAHLDEYNPEDLTICQMIDSMSVSLGLLR